MVTLATEVSKEILQTYEDLKMKQAYKYMIMNLKEKDVTLQFSGKPTETFADFANKFTEDDPVYAIYDLDVKYPDGHTSNYLCFFMYVPDQCKIKPRVQYSGSKEGVKAKFSGIAKEFQVNAKKDLVLQKFVDTFLGGKVIS